MTEGERMVWAVAFSRYLRDQIEAPPSHVVRGDGWEEWEVDQAVSAAEMACAIVTRMRQALPRTAEGCGDDSDVYEMLAEMVGK